MRKQEFAAKEDASGAFEKFVFNEIIVDDWMMFKNPDILMMFWFQTCQICLVSFEFHVQPLEYATMLTESDLRQVASLHVLRRHCVNSQCIGETASFRKDQWSL